MRLTRIYLNVPLQIDQDLLLPPEPSNHLINVLRLPVGSSLVLFNGKGGEFSATIIKIEKRNLFVCLNEFHDVERESPLTIHLAQAISRGEKMDFTIQKAIELGVNEITPILSERCGVKLSEDRQTKRSSHWQKIIISACEQCGRNKIPRLNPILPIEDFLSHDKATTKLILHHQAKQTLSTLIDNLKILSLLIGPEGGLTEAEVKQAENHGVTPIRLGPRILRTETAALATISALQSQQGDF